MEPTSCTVFVTDILEYIFRFRPAFFWAVYLNPAQTFQQGLPGSRFLNFLPHFRTCPCSSTACRTAHQETFWLPSYGQLLWADLPSSKLPVAIITEFPKSSGCARNHQDKVQENKNRCDICRPVDVSSSFHCHFLRWIDIATLNFHRSGFPTWNGQLPYLAIRIHGFNGSFFATRSWYNDSWNHFVMSTTDALPLPSDAEIIA